MLRDAQRRREEACFFGPAFSLGPNRAQECSRGGESLLVALHRQMWVIYREASAARRLPSLFYKPEPRRSTCPLPIGLLADPYQQSSQGVYEGSIKPDWRERAPSVLGTAC